MTSGDLHEQASAPPPGSPRVGGRRRRLSPAARIALQIGAAVVLAALVRSLVVQTYYVPTASMEPAVRPGDRVLVNRLAGRPERGDVIVFDGTEVFAGSGRDTRSASGPVGRALDSIASALSVGGGERDYLKRVVGLPGDHVTCCTATGELSVNGTPVAEGYLPGEVPASADPFDVEVPEDRLFVLGDNRPESSDSRDHLGDPGGGMVPVRDVVGTVLVRYWPLDRLGRLPDAPALHDLPGGDGGGAS